ncbi:MAG: hypothetical protein ISR65_16650 [Bacteriovoracaceae bacterium]|nr:hypothetical protein [Bacteriovoracaceae bacterium]
MDENNFYQTLDSIGYVLPVDFFKKTSPEDIDKLAIEFATTADVKGLDQHYGLEIESSRGLIDYSVEWGGHEGVFIVLIIFTLPFITLYLFSKILPFWDAD